MVLICFFTSCKVPNLAIGFARSRGSFAALAGTTPLMERECTEFSSLILPFHFLVQKSQESLSHGRARILPPEWGTKIRIDFHRVRKAPRELFIARKSSLWAGLTVAMHAGAVKPDVINLGNRGNHCDRIMLEMRVGPADGPGVNRARHLQAKHVGKIGP